MTAMENNYRPSYFTRVFQKAYGILPKEFIAKHANKTKK